MASTYAYSILGALAAGLDARARCSARSCYHRKTEEKETLLDRAMKGRYVRILSVVLDHRLLTLAVMGGLLAYAVHARCRASAASSCPSWRRATSGSGPCCRGPSRCEEAARMAPRLREVIAVGARGQGRDVARRPSRRRYRRDQLLQPGVQRPAEADGAMAAGDDPQADRGRTGREVPRLPGHRLQLLAAHPRQRRRRRSRGSRGPTR